MTEYTTSVNDKGVAIEVEVGADGKNPVSPNNPPAKAIYVNRRDQETPGEDESQGIDGDRVVSPNNPPENTQNVSEDVYGGVAPEGVSDAVVEAALNEQYPASYNPVKGDVVVNDEGLQQDAPGYQTEYVEGGEVETAGDEAADEDGAPNKSATKGEWVDYAVKQGMDRDEAEEATKDDLIEKYGN